MSDTHHHRHIEQRLRDPAPAVDGKTPPTCARCNAPMWLATFTRTVTDSANIERRDYECKRCGACDTVEESRPFIGTGTH